MKEQFERTALLLGEEAIDKLQRARVAVFGVGGVGGFAAEALARAGVGSLDLIDNDEVCLSNINRQIIATHDTVGRLKVDVAAERARSINPDLVIRTYPTFLLPDNADTFPFAEYDYIIDAIDTVTAKIELAVRARDNRVPIISAMGAGNKLDPTRFEVADLAKTTVCPLARVMRRELKKRNIEHMKVVYSREEALKPIGAEESADPTGGPRKRQTPGSVSFVPSVAGLILAGEVIRDLTGR